MNAYSVKVALEGEPPEQQFGIIAENVDEAVCDVHEKYLSKIFAEPDEMVVNSIVVIPLRPANIKRFVGTEKEVEFQAEAAVKEGHLFYLSNGHAYIAKCRAIRNGDPKHIQVLVYNDEHEVHFA